MSWAGRNWAAALGAALLVGVLALNVASLTTAPVFHPVEPYYLSVLSSFLDGDGYKPTMLLDAGVFDGVPDYWDARVASVPSLLSELIFPTTLASVRAPILLTALAALAVFWLGVRRILGGDIALIATAALASTWGFFLYSHWVRWDATAVLAMCAILALLVRGAPSLTAAALAGGVLGIGSDFVNSVPAAVPGVLVLCAWERERRWARLGALAGGGLAGVAVYALLHFAPAFDLGEARAQFDVMYRPLGYGEVPLIDAIKELSLEPLLNETDRYNGLAFYEWQTILIALALAVFAGLAVLLKTLGVRSRWLPVLSFAGLGLIALIPLLGSTPHTELRDALGPMVILGAGLVVVLMVDALRVERPYPSKAAPAILLIGLLVGWAIYVHLRTPWYGGYALPFAVAAFACGLHSLSPVRWRRLVSAGGLAVATVASSLYLIHEIRNEPSSVFPDTAAAVDGQAAERAREIVPPGNTVMGDWAYWWFFKDDRFRAHTTIWLQAWQHPDERFAEVFHRVCPDYVLLDDLWLDLYEPATAKNGRDAPNVFPTDPRERQRLLILLRSEYELTERLQVDGNQLAFWRRLAPDCPQADEAAS